MPDLRCRGKIRFGGPGAECGDRHTAVSQFLGKCLGEAEDIGLARVVYGHEWSRLKGRRRSDVQNFSRSAFDHRRQEQFGQLCESCDVDLDHLQLAIEIRIHEFAAKSKAGIVDENFDRDVLVAQKIGDRLGRFLAAQVGCEDMGGDLEFALQLAGRRFESIPFSRDENDIEAVAGENFCELEPDSAGAAGDERGSSRRAVRV